MPNASEFSKNYQVAGYECDPDSTLSAPTIFNWLQDSMDKFSRAHGVGYDFCSQQGLTYILREYDVKIDELPKWTDVVQMHTVLSDINAGSFFFRQDLHNPTTKQLLFSAASHVVLLNLLKNRPAKVTDCAPTGALKTLNEPLAFTKLKPLPVVHTTQEQDVAYDHIDFNQHVNNTNYVTFAGRTLDPVFLKKAKLKRIQVAYRQAAVMGDRLKIESQIAPGFTDHQISNARDNTLCARVRFSWAQKDR